MIYVLSEQALPSSWPYFKRSAPTGIGLQGMTKSPHKVQVCISTDVQTSEILNSTNY